ncbi:M23 family metallopeptidase [Paenibacillus alkaliterrae]|uniref:M23 family metallopeptidase n=1 Tax=Paenibacillus alkaliterrae TaxID=320909 RepID=UPI001F1F23E1|nr:M23 family metallopeptidase [Paenibacillus alkaliterrae]MCF2938371.1 M23 family metallopeptidase [Paenibacillus alkaliterrae]
MNDQNKPKQRPEETPKTVLGGTSAAKSSSGWKNLFAKRWVSPAIFMAAAAIIVTLMWIYQGADQASPTTGKTGSNEVSQGDETIPQGQNDETMEVAIGDELMQWPVVDKTSLKIERPFFDENASEAEQEAAVVQVGNTFTTNTGIDFVNPNGDTFDVLAALSGKVTHVSKHATNGNVIEITHADGLVTVYQSVAEIQVAEGDDVRQGTKIAIAGRSDVGRDLGIHLHFETIKDGKPVNPNSLITE